MMPEVHGSAQGRAHPHSPSSLRCYLPMCPSYSPVTKLQSLAGCKSTDCFRGVAQHPQHSYVVAQVDYMKDALQGIKVTPTFAVFKKGRKVDQFFGPSPQQLRDRVWLHSDDAQDR